MHTVVETAEFQKQARAVWSDAEREGFIDWIAANPGAGDDEIVLLVMVYAKAVQANVKPKDLKGG